MAQLRIRWKKSTIGYTGAAARDHPLAGVAPAERGGGARGYTDRTRYGPRGTPSGRGDRGARWRAGRRIAVDLHDLHPNDGSHRARSGSDGAMAPGAARPAAAAPRARMPGTAAAGTRASRAVRRRSISACRTAAASRTRSGCRTRSSSSRIWRRSSRVPRGHDRGSCRAGGRGPDPQRAASARSSCWQTATSARPCTSTA